MDKLIKQFKNIRKKKYIVTSYKHKYAFVGIGNHSINNLYPVINYLRAELKYIVTQSSKNANLINDYYPNSEGTNDLQKVINDEQIKGVFICASPKSHFDLVKQLLLANKNVFVEKPPCLTHEELKELIECEKSSKGKCFVGLQKQYAPVNLELRKKLQGKSYYNYRYVTGAYPEGEPFLDLFIHPIAMLSYLFGSAELKYIATNKSKAGVTAFLHLQHENGSNGIVELSSDYSWTNASENMIINTNKGVYEVTNNENLTFTPKSGIIFNIPKEKIFGSKMTSVTLKKRNNFNPIFENNQLYTSGYFGEIENFINFCEGKKYENNASLKDCLNTYEILTKIINK
ncbi:MAG: Gfo/Idh/MocA family oxidoreductase [Bacteroidetes bacterium]|nr:Gfo/Idh/MocA family oxidoreductase [Bacteroidota bacterium]